MKLPSTLSIGPISLPSALLLIAIAVVAGYCALSILTRGRPKTRKRLWNIEVNALFIGLLAWKIAPIIFRFSTFIQEPLLLLYYPGGTFGTIVGTAAGGIYLVLKKRKLSHPLRHLWPIPASLIVTAGVYLLLSTLLLGPSRSSVTIRPESAPTGTSVGEAAPSVTLENLSGEAVSLFITRDEPTEATPVIILNFWTSWCPPCRAELPEFQHFNEKIIKTNVRLLAVNLTSQEKSREAVLHFVEENDISFSVLLDSEGKAARLYEIVSIPTTYIIGPNGVIRAKKTGVVTSRWLEKHTTMEAIAK